MAGFFVLLGIGFFALPALAAREHISLGRRRGWWMLAGLSVVQGVFGIFSFVGVALLPAAFTILATGCGIGAEIPARQEPAPRSSATER